MNYNKLNSMLQNLEIDNNLDKKNNSNKVNNNMFLRDLQLNDKKNFDISLANPQRLNLENYKIQDHASMNNKLQSYRFYDERPKKQLNNLNNINVSSRDILKNNFNSINEKINNREKLPKNH